ncbi:ABC molybdenum transporter, periplasmic binding protein ModA [Psychrobacter arcticus 273-4]|uniref:ABC molybdenum transporter, periplasmic binding protein ModA n=1 Tax=Psychrobacter arcticus (strain DSM 17307 / VKM B-2377 / 273-4) TaxID=259536 RepID=Q4FU31_PSYA2|nr:molybdate ABC transporter substrate-binding protein [Psychrobacter arcticus]AAZ18477.1 ABC molybdenum transporter, periplasmic binding protein ModA [Psychrobacter arcticus 273-4]
MKINTVNDGDTKTLIPHFTTVFKALLTVSASTFLALTLTSCAKESTTNTAQAAVNDTTAQTETLRIAAAANLFDVLPDIVEAYKADRKLPDQDIEVTFASSGKLYAQITSGAPYDIFLSANQTFPAKLADELAHKRPQSEKTYKPFTYTQGQLALYSVTTPMNGLEAFTANPDSKITIANPELAPYGESAKAYLQSQNIYDSLNEQKRIIQAENIGQAFQYAHTGSVDYGFVAQSQITAIKATPEQFYTLPPNAYPPILQDGMVITDGATATDFTDYIRSPVGQAYFSKAGYLAVK